MGAKVSAKSLKTGAVLTRSTDKDGFFVLSPMDVGDYIVAADAKGFEKLLRENIHVDGMQVLGLNLTLQVSSTNLTVTVTPEMNSSQLANLRFPQSRS